MTTTTLLRTDFHQTYDFKRLFPNDIEKWVRRRYLRTEKFLVSDCQDWVSDLSQVNKDPARRAFYRGLFAELARDGADTWEELYAAHIGVCQTSVNGSSAMWIKMG